MLNKNNKPMPEPAWVPVTRQLPNDGQVVLVRSKNANEPEEATFRATPVARWEVGPYVYQQQYFDEWIET